MRFSVCSAAYACSVVLAENEAQISKSKSAGQASVDADLAALGLRIARVRERVGLTQVELTEAVGLHSVTISRIETAKQSVSVASLIHIAQALDTKAALLLEPEVAEDNPGHG